LLHADFLLGLLFNPEIEAVHPVKYYLTLRNAIITAVRTLSQQYTVNVGYKDYSRLKFVGGQNCM
jgi:hypothetical protein